jgi:hypothetical protein
MWIVRATSGNWPVTSNKKEWWETRTWHESVQRHSGQLTYNWQYTHLYVHYSAQSVLPDSTSWSCFDVIVFRWMHAPDWCGSFFGRWWNRQKISMFPSSADWRVTLARQHSLPSPLPVVRSTINCKKLSSLKLVCFGQPSLKNSKNQGILSSP